VRAQYPGTVIGAGDFGRTEGNEALRQGRCDVIAFGRRFIANPDLVERFRRDAHENAWDEARYFTPDDAGFTDFLTLEQEERAAADT
jgi:N-ethylmaleimide reductase